MATPAVKLGTDFGQYQYGWADREQDYVFKPKRGLTPEVVEEISFLKSEPKWMRDLRLRSYQAFMRRPMPKWGGDLGDIHFDDIYYFVRATEKQATTWEELPQEIKDTYDKLGIPEAEKQRLISGVAAQYECTSSDTRVWTADRGLVQIKDIQPGDRVFALDEEQGRFVVAPVKAAVETGVRQTYQVRVGNRAIRATDNHPVLTLSDERKPGRQRARYARRWKTVGELQVGDLVAVPRGLPGVGVARELPEWTDARGRGRAPSTSTTDLMWLLGLYLGDGNLQSAGRTHRLQLAIPATDIEVRAEIARVVDVLFGLQVMEPDTERVVVNSKALVRWFEDLGFVGTSLTKQIPAWVFSLPTDQRLSFLGGWIDADGYVGPERSGSIALTSGNLPLFEQGSELALLTGLRTAGPYRFTSRHPHDADREIVGYRLLITGSFDRIDCRNPKRTDRFGRRKYHHSATTAKGTTFRTHTTEHLGFARVTEITPWDVEPVWDIEVDGPHNFIAEGMVVHNSEVVYHKVREDLEKEGVLFLDTDTALREHEDLFREHFGKIIPPNDNKFAALNTAVWSGGSFVWIPEGVKVEIPLQAYFRINKENMGQFERTLIIAEPGSYVHYVEGCTAPVYSSDSLHSAVVEIIVKPGARVRYTTIQNWSNNVYNLVTKRAVAHEDATMEWIDANLGCLAEGSTVTTRGGIKPIEEVFPGEDVLSFDEATGELCFRTVTAKRYSGEQAVREVSVESRRIRVTDNHPFYGYLSEGPGDAAYIRADAVRDVLLPGDAALAAARDGAGGVATAVRADLVRATVTVSEPLEVVPTWDIEVEGTGNFVSEGFIVHNSKLTMKYPAVWLMGRGARGEVLSVASAGTNQHQDAGAKMVHHASDTSSQIVSKSIARGEGRTSYRGLVKVEEGARRVRASVKCDALLLDDHARSDTYPYMEIGEEDARVEHEATVSKIGDDQLFYLRSRGLSEDEAAGMIVRGFVEPIARELPMEYAVELNRLIALEMEGAIG